MDSIIASAQLRKLIIEKIKQYDISSALLCKKLDIPYTAFNRYLSENFSEESFDSDRIKVKQEDVFSICKELGIDIRIKVIINDSFTPDKELLKTTQAFNKNLTKILNQETKINF